VIASRNGLSPVIGSTTVFAPSAQVVGNVTIGERCFIDYGVVIESSGAPITIGNETIVLANTVIRSVGGKSRPPFGVSIGNRTLIGPLCAFAGCSVGSHCYIATSVLIFQGAKIGDNCRIAAGAIVHLRTSLPSGTHIGLRNIAVPKDGGYLETADIGLAREAIAKADFFRTVFEESAEERDLQSNVIDRLLEEVFGWKDSELKCQGGATQRQEDSLGRRE
jgi:carbonic anhydrase/acetyltransferase-like protein (isoleucine patch superfamily)